MGEFPSIRYNINCVAAMNVALNLQERLGELLEQDKRWWRHGAGDGKASDRAQLLVFCRSEDFGAALLHDFHFQPMVREGPGGTWRGLLGPVGACWDLLGPVGRTRSLTANHSEPLRTMTIYPNDTRTTPERPPSDPGRL